MLDKTLSKNKPKNYKFVIITLDSHSAGPVARVQAKLKPYFPTLEITVHAAAEWAENPKSLEIAKNDILNADIIIANLLFLEEHVRAILPTLKTKRENCDALVGCISSKEVVSLTRMDRLDMSKPTSGFLSLLKKLRGSNKSGKPASGKRQMSILRRLPKILRFIPGKAQDVRSYFLTMLYWLGGSDDNVESMIIYLCQKYGKLESKSNLVAKPPIEYPETGLYHPKLKKRVSTSIKDLPSKKDSVGKVGILLMRSYVLSGDTAHYDAVISELESMNLQVIPAFSASLDSRPAINEFFYVSDQLNVDCILSLTGFSLVGGPAYNDSKAAEDILSKLDVPYIAAHALEFQTLPNWQENDIGLGPVETTMLVALPEIDGAIAPTVFGGRMAHGLEMQPSIERVKSLSSKVQKYVNLRNKNLKDKKLSIVLYGFPPNAGAIGTAAYLDVFQSLFNTLSRLKEEGYSVDLPSNVDELKKSILNGNKDQYGQEANVYKRISADDIVLNEPFLKDIEKTWGPAPGKQQSDGSGLFILGEKFGNIFVGIQPAFGYEGDPMRLLFEKGFAPTHAFSTFYRFIKNEFETDAIIHFGMHGALEFMPGKKSGASESCWPDRLIGNIPNIYIYAANNPSEATIAKRRGYASTISYLTPPAENAGLYKGLKELSELVGSYQQLRENSRGIQIVNAIVETSKQCNLDKDVELPSKDVEELSIDERDLFVGNVYKQLMEIESRLLPCGLHTIGEAPTAEEAVATLVNIASLEREQEGLRSLPGLLAESIGLTIEQIYDGNNKGELKFVELNEKIIKTARESSFAMVNSLKIVDGRVYLEKSLLSKLFDLLKVFGINLPTPWLRVCRLNGFNEVNQKELNKLFDYLLFCLEQVCADKEMDSLIKALDGNYVLPGPGGDPIRNPGVLPSGKNIHALDPQSIPTTAAVAAAKSVVDKLIERQKEEQGTWPETIACVLWGTDNIKTYGESLAQILWFVGVKPKPDSVGRINKLELIPLEELGRPRIDVVVNCSGVFRDLFINQMALIDQAVKLAAEADEPLESNFVRKHSLDQAEKEGTSIREASARVFSNASGSYSSNVNLAVENSTWEEENELLEMYLSRKTYAFNADNPGEMNQKRDVFESVMKTADVTFQNLDSSEISLTDVSHYFDSDPTKLIKTLRDDGKEPSSYIADTTTSNAQVRTLGETIRLDSRTKLLNPKWYEGMLKSGYEGVRELSNRLNYTLGWSATSGQVDNFVYEETNETFINDEEMRKRLMDLNPNSFRRIVGTLLEVNGRGYWETSDENIEQLKELYQEVEDKIEGVKE